jgi:AraC-like DNA-binding protein
MQGTISVQSIRSYLGLAAMRGLDVRATVEASGAERSLEDIDGRVPWPVCQRIGAEIVSRIGVVGAVEAMGSLGESGVSALYYVARHSATVGLALRRIVHYYGVTSSVAECVLREDASPARLELRQRAYVTGPIRGLISALWCVSNVATLRQMLGGTFNPAEVEIEMAPPEAAHVESFARVLRCPIHFGSRHSVVAMPRDVLADRVLGADPVLEAAVLKYAAELLERSSPEGEETIRSRLRRHLVGTMASGDVALRRAARHLGTTGRTLQRRLHEEGTSFNEVLDGVRREVALAQMRARRRSIDELAFVLGFEKSSSFHRAFKRWTGLTPGEFRRQG